MSQGSRGELLSAGSATTASPAFFSPNYRRAALEFPEIPRRTQVRAWRHPADLPRIQYPTLAITTEGSTLGSVESMRALRQKIPNSKLLALPGDSFHVAATDSEPCARETRDFMLRSSG